MKRLVLIPATWLLAVSQLLAQQTLILQPGPDEGEDLYINSAFPSSQWGAENSLVACAWTFQGTFGIGRALVRFDLSAVPANATVLDAKLTLFFDPNVAFGMQSGDNASQLNRISEPWDEMVTTWDTRPSIFVTDPVMIPATTTQYQDLRDIDITKFVANWVANPETNFGFQLKIVTEETYRCLVLSSSDQVNPAKRPMLVVRYVTCDPPVAGFSTLIEQPKVTFTDTSSSATAWRWDFGDGYFATVQNPVHIYSQPGIYNVCLVVNDSCGTDTVCKAVQVCNMPATDFSVTVRDLEVTFSDLSVEPQSWQWSFGDGFYSDLQNPVHTFNAPGSYWVCEWAANSCGTEMYCDSITVEVSGLVNAGSAVCLLYPNPAFESVTVTLPYGRGEAFDFILMNLQGKVCVERHIEPGADSGSVTIGLPDLAAGLYMARIRNDRFQETEKLVIQ